MTIPDAIAIPLRIDEHGVIRVGGTRVTLESVMTLYQRGESPEDIMEAFPTLTLLDIHLVIAYYLQNRDEVEEYLRQTEIRKEEVRKLIQSRMDPDLRARLLARRNETTE